MGSLFKESPSLVEDLKVTIKDTCVVFPPEEAETKTLFLSNIDQVLNFDVETLHFFPYNPKFPPDLVAQKLKETLEKLLVPYNFLAGRLKVSPETGRLEIDCNGAGAVFVVASSECTLDELGDLVYPNPAFGKLINKDLDILDRQDLPLCIIQVTSFRCGGFAMGISTNHTTFDGLSFKSFLLNIAAVAAGNPLAVTPCNDRRLLAARSPPRITRPHPELLSLGTAAPAVFDLAREALDFKIFRLTSADVSALKDRAGGRVSGFNAVTAHIWRCKALSHGGEDGRESRILFAVNIRRRLDPPLPDSYAGNAVLTAYAAARCGELKEAPLGRLVEMVVAGVERMNDEYARSAIDWGEVNRGFPDGEVLVSSWWKLGFDQVEYPWGPPAYSCPVVYHRKDIILLFPDTVDKEGVNVLVALPPPQMARFHSLFQHFLLHHH